MEHLALTEQDPKARGERKRGSESGHRKTGGEAERGSAASPWRVSTADPLFLEDLINTIGFSVQSVVILKRLAQRLPPSAVYPALSVRVMPPASFP